MEKLHVALKISETRAEELRVIAQNAYDDLFEEGDKAQLLQRLIQEIPDATELALVCFLIGKQLF